MGTLYITVHGTGDGHFAAVGEEPKWWETTSPFTKELLAQAPPGSSVEPFLWSGANDEVHRRQAAAALDKLLRKTEAARVVLVGHSHGGSVIATALQLAAARRDELQCLQQWVTIGTPFIRMRRRFWPWERYTLFGQTLLSFIVLLAVIGVLGFGTFFESTIVLTCAAAVAVLTLIFVLSQRANGALYSRRARRAFEQSFKQRWRGVASSHDEATNGLARLPSIKVTLFDWTVLAPAVRAIVSLVFVLLTAAAWLSLALGGGTSLVDQPLLASLINGQIWALASWNVLVSDALLSRDWDPANESHRRMLDLAIAAWAISSAIAYLLALWLLLALTDFIVRVSVGMAVASGLNRSVNEMILKRAYGNTTTGEHAFAARTTPFDSGPDVERLPEEVNAPLLAFARSHASDTLARLHDSLFREDGVSDEELVKDILERISWRELIHTAYFKVEEPRRYIASRIVQPTAP